MDLESTEIWHREQLSRAGSRSHKKYAAHHEARLQIWLYNSLKVPSSALATSIWSVFAKRAKQALESRHLVATRAHIASSHISNTLVYFTHSTARFISFQLLKGPSPTSYAQGGTERAQCKPGWALVQLVRSSRPQRGAAHMHQTRGNQVFFFSRSYNSSANHFPR